MKTAPAPGVWAFTLLVGIVLTVTETQARIPSLDTPRTSQEPPEERSTTWNSILNTEGIFLDTLKCTGVSVVSATNVFITYLNDPDQLHDVYTKYQIMHSKPTTTLTRERLTVFRRNLIGAFKHNLEARLGMKKWEQGINRFSDMTLDEITNSSTGALPETDTDGIPIIDGTENDSDDDDDATESGEASGESLFESEKRKRRVGRATEFSVDYRDKGIVPPVQNQEVCGSCYAFAATAVLESAYAKTHRNRNNDRPKILKLSEKELVDCSTKYGNNGCNGGNGAKTFTYLQKEGQTLLNKRRGYPLAYSFPSKKPDSKGTTEKTVNYDQCSRNDLKAAAKVKKFGRVKPNDEEALRRVVDKYGPTYVGIDLSTPEGEPTFNSYKSGVFDSCKPAPSGERKGHAVVIVGYGAELVGGELVDYWIVRNSWADTWGANGYIKILRGANMCDIAKSAYAITSVEQ